MHYKIASLILNASKHQTGSREVFVAQPDAQRESLAGKIFLMAEIGGKKSEAKQAIDFILDGINKFYYEDEKIFLQDKVEGLTLENIFEAALAKINKALVEFLNEKKFFLHPQESSLILGLIFENKLYFSNFGRHKAFLINKQDDNYELINVEASATDVDNDKAKESDASPKFFASVISGQIPPSSYFLFCNEVLTEYLSNKELINIISKLPPMVAAEQIKSSLAKLNSYVPFLGIIIKNTHGLSLAELKDEAHVEILKSAHNSISHLNYTEAQTEKMLSPAGLFNWHKLINVYKKIKNKIKGNTTSRMELKDNRDLPELKKQKTLSASKILKEKLIVGRSHSRILGVLKIIWTTLINIINPIFWARVWKSFRSWLSQLHPKNKSLFIALSLLLLVLVISVMWTSVNNRRKEEIERFDGIISSLEVRRDMIDSYLLYENEEAAKNLIGEIIMELELLEPRNQDQISRRDNLKVVIDEKKARVQKLTTINSPQFVFDFKDHNSSAETRNIIVFNKSIYAADPLAKAVYIWNFETNKSDSFLLSGDISSLDKPVIENNLIYYLNNRSLVSLNPVDGRQTRLNIDGLATDNNIDNFGFYGGSLYLMMSDNNQVFRLSATNPNFSNRTARLANDTFLGDAVDMAITASGNISILKNNGKIEDFRGGVLQDFNLVSVDPSLDSASLLKFAANRYFILDKSSKRFLVFDLNGKLMQQYRLPSLNNLKDFDLSKDSKSAYLLNDDSIYEITLE